MNVFILASNFAPFYYMLCAIIFVPTAIVTAVIYFVVADRIKIAKERNQNWCRLHLSTLAILSLLAGGIMTVNYLTGGYPCKIESWGGLGTAADIICGTFVMTMVLFVLETVARRKERPQSVNAKSQHDTSAKR